MLASDTEVTFPGGATLGRSSGLLVTVGFESSTPNSLLLVARTPFHPLDHHWPDQPGDTGSVDVSGWRIAVSTSSVASLDHKTFTLYVDKEIRQRPGDAGVTFHVAHILSEPGVHPDGAIGLAELKVDVEYRQRLSRAHSACHLMALALNRSLAPLWSKEVRRDSLGSPNFDALAIQSSTIDETGSTDVYRIGKSLRKSGFAPNQLRDGLDGIVTHINRTLEGWIEIGGKSMIIADSPSVVGRRSWSCALADGRVMIPCGGTHVPDIRMIGSTEVAGELNPEGTQLSIRTTIACFGPTGVKSTSRVSS